jgi:transposase-like protein
MSLLAKKVADLEHLRAKASVLDAEIHALETEIGADLRLPVNARRGRPPLSPFKATPAPAQVSSDTTRRGQHGRGLALGRTMTDEDKEKIIAALKEPGAKIFTVSRILGYPYHWVKPIAEEMGVQPTVAGRSSELAQHTIQELLKPMGDNETKTARSKRLGVSMATVDRYLKQAERRAKFLGKTAAEPAPAIAEPKKGARRPNGYWDQPEMVAKIVPPLAEGETHMSRCAALGVPESVYWRIRRAKEAPKSPKKGGKRGAVQYTEAQIAEMTKPLAEGETATQRIARLKISKETYYKYRRLADKK